jgi:glycine oxidase
VTYDVSPGAELILEDGQLVGVHHQEVRVPADVAIVTAGPWSPEIIDPGGEWRPIRATWGVVASVQLAAPPRHVLEQAGIDIEPGDRGPAKRTDIEFSLVTAAGISAVGSTFLRERPEPSDYTPALLRHGAGYVPALVEAVPIGLRVCARPQSFDGRPLVGAIPWLSGVFVAAGHGPWGISTGPASARQVVDLVLGRSPAIDPALDVGRYPAPPPGGAG